MDFQTEYQPVYRKSTAMEIAALVTGILTLLTFIMMTVYLPFVFGSLSIVFAILSKGTADKMVQKAKIGMTCAITGMAVNLLLIVTCVYMFFSNQTVHDYVNQMFTQQYGESFEEMLDDAMKGELPYGNWTVD